MNAVTVSLEAELSKAQKQIEELKADLAAASAERDEMVRQRDAAVGEREVAYDRKKATQAAADAERHEARGVIAGLASKLAHLEADLHGALGRAAVHERGCTTLSGQLAAANEQVAELTEQLAQLEKGGRAA